MNDTIKKHQATGAKKLHKLIIKRLDHDTKELTIEAEKHKVGSNNRCRLDGWLESNEEIKSALELMMYQSE